MRSPSRVYLAPGMTFQRGPATYTVRAIDDWTHMTCEIQPGQLVTLEVRQFEQEYLQGHIVGLASQGRPIKLVDSADKLLDAHWELASEEQRDAARRQYEFIKHVERDGPVVFDTFGVIEDQLARAAEALDQSPPSRVTFWRWYRRYIDYGGTIEACLRHRHVHGSSRKSRLHEEAKRFLDEEIASFSTGENKRTAHEWTRHLNDRIARHNDRLRPTEAVPPVSEATWKRHVKQLPMMVQLEQRVGKHAARAKLKAFDKVADPDFPLQVVQIDHTKLQINCRDEQTGKLFSEIWATVILDRKTRCVMSAVLHVARHDAEVVGRCFAMMALPKSDFKSWCPEAVSEWGCYGLPNLLLGDNGKEFLSESFRTLAAKFSVNLGFAPAFTPEWKGSIERWFGTMKGNLIKRLSGATERPTPGKRPGPKPAEGPAFTLAELDALIARWIVDVYHLEKHSALGMSPIEAWNRGIVNVFRSIPASVDDLLCRMGRPSPRRLGPQGVLVDNDQYKSPELDTLFTALGPKADKVKVMTSNRSAYTVYVVDPISGNYLKAVNTNVQCRPEYTREQWERIKKQAIERGLDVTTEVGAETAAALTEQANTGLAKSTKATKRAIARKVRGEGGDFAARGPTGGAPNRLPAPSAPPAPPARARGKAPSASPVPDDDVIVVADLPFTPFEEFV
jgi:putative transposase